MATRKQKIEAILDSTTRDQKVERMLDSVDGWDAETMASWIKDRLQLTFDDMDDERFNDEYTLWFDDEFCDIDDDDDDDDDFDDDDIDDIDPCSCEWNVVYQQGCQCGGK